MGGYSGGGFCSGVLSRGILSLGDFVQGDFVRVILSRGVLSGGFCPGTIVNMHVADAVNMLQMLWTCCRLVVKIETSSQEVHDCYKIVVDLL